MGYRKALEFLVDSYIRTLEKDLPVDFSTLPLGVKISRYIDDDNMKDFIITIVRFIDYKYQCQKASYMISKK